MKKQKPRLRRPLKALGLTVVGLTTFRSAHATTSVDFEGLGHNVDVSQTFADNVSVSGTGYSSTSGLFVSGTPNIGLTWGDGTAHLVDSYQGWDGRGTVAQLDFTRSGANQISLLLTPDSAGYGTLVKSFYMDMYTGGGPMSVDWLVSDGTGTLASGNWSRSSGGRDQILTGLGAGNITLGQTVTLQFTKLTGNGSYFAVDNLVFDQVQAVPEPSTLALGALGLGALVMRRRK